MQALQNTNPPLEDRQRDYLLLTVFVLGQHGHFDRAKALVDGLVALDDQGDDLLLAQAVLAFFADDFHKTITCLDTLDERTAALASPSKKETEAKRMRRYLRARCYFQTGKQEEASLIAADLSAAPEKTRPKSSRSGEKSKASASKK